MLIAIISKRNTIISQSGRLFVNGIFVKGMSMETASVRLLDKLSIKCVERNTSIKMSPVVTSIYRKRDQPAVAAFVRKNLVSDLVYTVYLAVSVSSVVTKRGVGPIVVFFSSQNGRFPGNSSVCLHNARH